MLVGSPASMMEALTAHLVFAVGLVTTVAVVAVALVAGSLLVIVVRRPPRRTSHGGSVPWEPEVRQACREAKTIVDLVTPTGEGTGPPSTVALTEVATRLRHLDGRLDQVPTRVPPRVGEAVEDLRRVSLSMGAALDAERTIRLDADRYGRTRHRSATRLVIERSAELDMVVREVLWLVDTGR